MSKTDTEKKMRFLLFPKTIIPVFLVMIAGLSFSWVNFRGKLNKAFTSSAKEFVASYDMSAKKLIDNQLELTESTIGVMNSVLNYVALQDTSAFIYDMSAYLKDTLKMDSIPCYIHGPDGNPVLANKPFAPSSKLDGYIQRSFNGETIKHILIEGDQVIAAVDVPIYKYTGNGNRRQVGVLEGRKNIATKEFALNISRLTGGDVNIVAGNKVVASTLDSLIGDAFPENTIQDIEDDGGKHTARATIGNSQYLVTSFIIPNVDGNEKAYISILSPYEKTLEQSANALFGVGLGNASIFMVIFVALIFIIVMFFINPISSIRFACKELSEGEMDLTYRIQEKNNDELGDTARYINLFIDRLQKIVVNVNGAANETLDAVNSLLSSSEETSSATNQILGNIGSVKEMTAKQSVSIENVDGIMAGASTAIDTLNENVEKQNSNVDESSSATEEMVGNTKSVDDNTKRMKSGFDSLNDAIHKGKEKSNDILEAIRAISEKSADLGAANDTIQNIAGETNLLSMNASIESAHAGEAGKGFAVVAGEIRKLAEDSQKQSTAIGESISQIASVIEAAEKAGAEFNQAMNEIYTNTANVAPLIDQISMAMDEQSSAANQVIDSLSQIKDSSSAVSDSIRNVIDSMGNTKNEMNSVVQITQNIVGSMDEMAAGSQQINQGSSLVADEARHVKDKMTVVSDNLKLFKV